MVPEAVVKGLTGKKAKKLPRLKGTPEHVRQGEDIRLKIIAIIEWLLPHYIKNYSDVLIDCSKKSGKKADVAFWRFDAKVAKSILPLSVEHDEALWWIQAFSLALSSVNRCVPFTNGSLPNFLELPKEKQTSLLDYKFDLIKWGFRRMDPVLSMEYDRLYKRMCASSPVAPVRKISDMFPGLESKEVKS